MAIVIVKQPISITAADDATVIFRVEATGVASYKWQTRGSYGNWNDTTRPGYDTNALTVEGFSTRSKYLFRCVLTDANGNTVVTNAVKVVSETASRGMLDYTTIKDIADAIRAKTGSTETMLPSEMARLIEAMEAGNSDFMTEGEVITFSGLRGQNLITIPCSMSELPARILMHTPYQAGLNAGHLIAFCCTDGSFCSLSNLNSATYGQSSGVTFSLKNGELTITANSGKEMAIVASKTYTCYMWR